MNAIQTLFNPLDEGKHIIIQTGRDLRDFTIDEKGRITPLIEVVRKEALKRGLILIEYSRSSGITFDASSLTKTEAQDVNNVLKSMGITKSTNESPDSEFVQVMRGLLRLVQAANYPTFRDGRQISFMILIEFAEHNAPDIQPGFLSPEQMVSIELASKLSKSLGLRRSGSYVVFSEAREGKLNDLLVKQIDVLRIQQPDSDEKKLFLKALKNRYPNAKIEGGLTDDIIINITSNTPNRGMEQIFLSSTKTGNTITSTQFYKKKQEDIISISEKTLEAVDTGRISNQKLAGRNIERPLYILSKAANSLRNGKSGTIRNIILAGAPATGKTHLVTQAAAMAKIQAFMINSPKGSLVGESERKTKLMLATLKEQRGIGIIDELEMVLPMNRNGSQNNDSGVTQNLMGQLQTFLSDSSLEGKVSLFATSNKPGNISAAMLSRWNVVPVLMPLKEDYPLIVESIFKSMLPKDNN
ncbi:MAG: AAA family ATPase, partial [Chlorobi bacterium]|nr:AAA family ATPase [Chlorobiota bacterium]